MMDILEALQEERKKHPNAQILIAAINEWYYDGQIVIRRDWNVSYEPFLYWEDDVFYDDYDDCVQNLMDRLDLTEDKAEEHIEQNGYEEAIVIYAY